MLPAPTYEPPPIRLTLPSLRLRKPIPLPSCLAPQNDMGYPFEPVLRPSGFNCAQTTQPIYHIILYPVSWANLVSKPCNPSKSPCIPPRIRGDGRIVFPTCVLDTRHRNPRVYHRGLGGDLSIKSSKPLKNGLFSSRVKVAVNTRQDWGGHPCRPGFYRVVFFCRLCSTEVWFCCQDF